MGVSYQRSMGIIGGFYVLAGEHHITETTRKGAKAEAQSMLRH